MLDLDENSLERNNSKLGKLEVGFLCFGSAVACFAISSDLYWPNFMGVDLEVFENNYARIAIPFIATGISSMVHKLGYKQGLLSKRGLKAFGVSSFGAGGGYIAGKFVKNLFDVGGLSGLNVSPW